MNNIINWRYVLIFVAGAILMYIVLSYLSHRTIAPGETWTRTKKVLGTMQFYNVIKTNEFRELVKTKEFQDVVKSLAEDQVLTVAQSLTGPVL